MTNKVQDYKHILELALSAQDAGKVDIEESYMAQLDDLWLSMTDAELADTRKLARSIAAMRCKTGSIAEAASIGNTQ